jgi:phage baseplate assembly protein W
MSIESTTIYGVIPGETAKKEATGEGSLSPILGVCFPLSKKEEVSPNIFLKARGMDLIKSMVRQFVKTERGERVMLPNFGLSLKRFLFEPITPDLILNIENEIYTGFAQYLPQVRILNLQVMDGDNVQGLGLPGIKITLVISPINSNEQAQIAVNL